MNEIPTPDDIVWVPVFHHVPHQRIWRLMVDGKIWFWDKTPEEIQDVKEC